MMKSTKNMFYVSVLLVSLLETQNTVNGGPAPQYFISTPQNTTVTAGHRAMLSCSVGNIFGTCQWTKDGLSVDGVSRYQLSSGRNGLCDLTIEPVLPIDEGVYQCQVSGGHGVAPISSAPVSLIVNREPGQPCIVQAMENGVMEMKEGEEVELQCESQGGRPPAEIQWWDGEGRRIVSDVTEHVRRMEDKKAFKTISTLKLVPQHHISVRCTVSNEAFQEDKSSQILEVRFKGQIALENMYLSEGESFIIDCNSDESQAMSYKWFINDKELFSENSKTLQIEHFVSAYDKSIVKCMGEGKMGEMEVFKLVKLNLDSSRDNYIKTKEPFVLPSQIFLKNNDTKIKRKHFNARKTIFTCIAEEENSEQPNYVWMNGQLEGKAVAEDDENRKFNCEVVPRGYNKLKKMAQKTKFLSKTFKKFRRSFNRIVTTMEIA